MFEFPESMCVRSAGGTKKILQINLNHPGKPKKNVYFCIWNYYGQIVPLRYDSGMRIVHPYPLHDYTEAICLRSEVQMPYVGICRLFRYFSCRYTGAPLLPYIPSFSMSPGCMSVMPAKGTPGLANKKTT